MRHSLGTGQTLALAFVVAMPTIFVYVGDLLLLSADVELITRQQAALHASPQHDTRPSASSLPGATFAVVR